MRRSCCAILLLLLMPAAVLAAGHAFNDNFSVLAPPLDNVAETQAYARQVLERAEEYRREIALEWLGAALPTGVGKTHINVAFSDIQDKGLIWPDDGPRRNLHRLFLKTTRDRAVGSTLKHEICHAVMAIRFPQGKRLPVWIEEGIASRYDDAERKHTRNEIVRYWAETGNWPLIRDELPSGRLPANNKEAYSLAVSLVDFLLSRADKQTLLDFAQDARDDLPRSLRAHYQIGGLNALQVKWQEWVLAQLEQGDRVALTPRNRR